MHVLYVLIRGWGLYAPGLWSYIMMSAYILWSLGDLHWETLTALPPYTQEKHRKSCGIRPKPAATCALTLPAAKYDKGRVSEHRAGIWWPQVPRLDVRLAGILSPVVFPNKPPATRTLAHLLLQDEEKKATASLKKRGGEKRGRKCENCCQDEMVKQRGRECNEEGTRTKQSGGRKMTILRQEQH